MRRTCRLKHFLFGVVGHLLDFWPSLYSGRSNNTTTITNNNHSNPHLVVVDAAHLGAEGLGHGWALRGGEDLHGPCLPGHRKGGVCLKVEVFLTTDLRVHTFTATNRWTSGRTVSLRADAMIGAVHTQTCLHHMKLHRQPHCFRPSSRALEILLYVSARLKKNATAHSSGKSPNNARQKRHKNHHLTPSGNEPRIGYLLLPEPATPRPSVRALLLMLMFVFPENSSTDSAIYHAHHLALFRDNTPSPYRKLSFYHDYAVTGPGRLEITVHDGVSVRVEAEPPITTTVARDRTRLVCKKVDGGETKRLQHV